MKFLADALISLFLSGVLSSSVFARTEAGSLYYLSNTDINIGHVLPKPPEPGSTAEKADFKKMISLQSSRTKEDCEKAEHIVKANLQNLFGAPEGPLKPDEVQKLTPFLQKVGNDTKFFVHEEKNFWNRPRPYLADKEIKPCVDLEESKSYPSGHAATSEVFAKVLAEIYPDRADAFLARAKAISDYRVLSGVHHPTDVLEGKVFGDEVFKVLMTHPKFKEEIAQLKK